MLERVRIAGVGIHPFGRFDKGYRELGAAPAADALADARVDLADVDMVLVANVGAEMAKGHSVVEQLGRPGIPIINVEAACASSASCLDVGSRLIESGAARIVLCIGVEKAPRGFIANCGYEDWQNASGLGVNPIYFALQAQELLDETDATLTDLADVSVKNHRHALFNQNAMYQKVVTREEVLESPDVCPPLRLLMLCAPNEGGAAALLMDADEAKRRKLEGVVSIRAVSVVSRAVDDWFLPAVSFNTTQRTSLTRRAALAAYEQADLGPEDLDLVECQDTDSGSELVAYSELGLCPPGDEAKLLRSGATALGGALPVNVSGGLLSKGEPLGASGLGMLHELVQQLRGQSGKRQVDAARVGLSHVMGAGGTVGVVVVSR
jgi:acetyl-CoA acetyltransferase